MPTPGERRALIFIASVAALGVAVRGWREFHPPDAPALAGNRAALARQIEAVDSAIAVTSSRRMPRANRAAREPNSDGPGAPSARVPREGTPRAAPLPRPLRTRRQSAPPDPQPRDPRQSYWDRVAYFDSVRLASIRASAGGHVSTRDATAPRSRSGRQLAAKSGPPLDLDLAGMDEVAALPLIGVPLARRIVSNRVDNGPFGSITGLQRVPGITPAFARRLEPFVTFSGSPRLGGAGESPSRSKSDGRPRGKSRP